MSYQKKDRLAVIGFDDMKLKKELAFDKGLDSEVGLHKQVQVCMRLNQVMEADRIL